MKKKTVLSITLCIALALSCVMMATACNKKEEAPASDPPASEAPAEETPAEEPTTPETTTDSAATDQTATDGGDELANPVVQSTPDEIKDKFGIEFQAPDEYADGATYSIVSDNIAQMEYKVDSGKGPISVTYRASKTDADDSLTISGDSNEYGKTEAVRLDNGQEVSVRTNDGTGPGLCLWYNENVVGGGLSASLSMDPIIQSSELTDVASFFVDQESKGF
jgi:hypothetical protein